MCLIKMLKVNLIEQRLKKMKPINLNADTTNLILDTDFVKREITSNPSQGENIDTYFRNKDLIDGKPSLDFPKFAVRNRKQPVLTNASVVQCI